jgi:hypothetical protein
MMGEKMTLHYFGLVFVVFGLIILYFRKYFLFSAIKGKNRYGGIGGYVKLQLLLNKTFKKDVPVTEVVDQHVRYTRLLILLTGFGFVIVGLLILIGVMPGW